MHIFIFSNFSRLPTHQDCVENRDRVYLYASLLANEPQLENDLNNLFFLAQEAIAYFPLIMLISAAVSSGMSKKLEGVVGSKVLIIKNM